VTCLPALRRAPELETTMTRFRHGLAALALLSGLPTALPAPGAPAEIVLTAAQIQALGITTTAPEPQSAGEIANLAAEVIVPNNQLFVVSTPLPGLVEAVLVAVNEDVRQGQLLARMQSSALAEAQRAYLQALTEVQLARANLDRDEKLAAEGLIAESRLLSTKAAHVQASAMLAERRHALNLAGMSDQAIAGLQTGTAITSSVSILAPATGVVVEQMAQAGQRLEAFTPIYRIARLDPLWLEVQVPLARAAGVQVGAPVRVPSVDAAGKIISIGRSVTPESQTIMLRALITRNARRLRPGQYVETTVETSAGAGDHWRVPNRALVRHRDALLVFGRTTRGFRPVPVRVVSDGARESIVAGPLGGYAAIALDGVASLKARLLGLGDH
jgi:multidrug efflux pump subunit AcrA (membrane-fusion protein)